MLRRLDVLVGDKMIEDDGNSVFIKDLVKARFFKFIYRHGRRDIVAEHDVKLCIDQLTGDYTFKPRVSGKNFLCHCHSHINSLPDS